MRWVIPSVAVLVVCTCLAIASVEPAGAAPNVLQKLSPEGGWQGNPFTTWYSGHITTEYFASPAIDDINNDGDVDVFAGFPDGSLYGWRMSDGFRWFHVTTGPGAVQGSPAIVDLFGDGQKQLLVANTAGDVWAIDANARVHFHIRLGAGVFSAPVAADLDADGQKEIVVTSWDYHLHVFQLDGSHRPGFPVFLQDTVWSSPAVADLDGDGSKEIVFGYDCDGAPGQNCAPHRGGYIGVIQSNGAWRPGFPRFVPQVVWSSPALGDLNGDGRLDIVVGTGNFFPNVGHSVYALTDWGADVGGWPVAVGGRTTSSPALSDLTGDGRLDVAIVAEDGKLYVIRNDGMTLWSRCIANDVVNGCSSNRQVGLHGSPSIAAIYGGEQQYVVVGGEQHLNVFDPAGNLTARGVSTGQTAPLTAAVSVANVGGRVLVAVASVAIAGGGQFVGQLFTFTTGTPLGAASWPTFHQNVQRTGSVLDVQPPTASLVQPPTPAPSRQVLIRWGGSDSTGGSGLAGFDVETNDNGQGWTRWLSNTAATSAPLWTLPAHSMRIRVRSRDLAGNTSEWVARSFTVAADAQGAPFTVAYAVGSTGRVSGIDSPPTTGPVWRFPIARGIGLLPNGGGYVLDGWGAVHPFGGAPPLSISAYWPGHDVTRGLALSSDGTWGYVVDVSGGLHPVGGARSVTNGPYWPGQDLVRGVALMPGATRANPAGWVLDSWGGLHAFGSAPRLAISGYWIGGGVARGFTINPDGTGYTVDYWGGLHPIGGARSTSGSAYWRGWDVASGVVSIGSANAPAGWTLDRFGGLHPFGDAPPVDLTDYGAAFDARAVALVR